VRLAGWKWSKYQIIAITFSLVLLGVLYYLPQKSGQENNPKHKEVVSEEHIIYADIIKAEKKVLADKDAALSAVLKNIEEGKIISDSLSQICLAASPLLSAHYLYQKAQITQTVSDWTKAGDYFMIALQSKNKSSSKAIITKATESFENAFKLDTNNSETKVRLASSYVEAGDNPMKGIILLREVIERQPNHLPAQFNMGLFSMKSGQYEKAISRFNKVLEIDSSYYQTYFYLGECEMQLGNKQKAIEYFKDYEYLCTDSIEKQNIKKYINTLLTK
jgi:tetratricopeptide (TPR) repeat protein